MLRFAAQSINPAMIAPDWDTRASAPGAAARCAKLALMPRLVICRPRQFGPRMRKQWGRAASSTAFFCTASSPAEIMTAARVPPAPISRTRAGMVAGGVAIIASSGTAGNSRVERTHARPSIDPALGLTKSILPPKPPWTRLRATVRPIEPGRALAPISTTERGFSSASRLRTVMSMPLLCRARGF